MRQVPPYLIVGRGRLAMHFMHYFDMKGIAYTQWDRAQAQTFQEVLRPDHVVLLAISDDAIESFVETHRQSIQDSPVIHFSGARFYTHIIGCHPLMTFSHDRYSLDTYESICFIVDRSVDQFKQLFPSLSNTAHYINPELKPMYHALCVLSGNATTVLWQAIQKQFQHQLDIPADVLKPYLKQICNNLLQDPDNALTGPWVRGDNQTIDQHRETLFGHPLEQVYESIYQLYRSQT